MAPGPRKTGGGQAIQAEVTLLSLKNCLVNLPSSLVTLLVNTNTVAQNVVVELQWRQNLPLSTDSDKPNNVPRSAFVGWTGMQSKPKLAPVVGREGFSRNSSEQEIPQVEIDGTFARLLGLGNGQKVGVQLHLDPPQAAVINIEPLTPADWEMIELHAKFLELNFLSQVRALPNPAYSPEAGAKQQPHPLTLHLSPTSTANIIVTSLSPQPPATSAFVKISPDAEVHVAPKTRDRGERTSGRPTRSVASTGRKSTGGKSGSTVRHRNRGGDAESKGIVFLRGVDRAFCGDYFDDANSVDAQQLTVWLDKELVVARALRGVSWVSVAIVKPAGLLAAVDPSKEQDAEKPASKVVARLRTWRDAPDADHVALSSPLCKVLGAKDMVGGLVRIEAAPLQLSRAPGSGSVSTKDTRKKTLKVLPFLLPSNAQIQGLRFGGDSKKDKDEAVSKLLALFHSENGTGLLDGPLTDGMILPSTEDSESSWAGGILRIEPPPDRSAENAKSQPAWMLGSEWKPSIDVQSEVARPANFLKGWQAGDQIPRKSPVMVGINSSIAELTSHLEQCSSVLLTGGLGAGKTSLANLLANHLRLEAFFYTTYFSCRSLATHETRASTIKETLSRLFGCAAWGARLGGKSLVILDDLDRLCPAETELQVGDENGRSRQISESLCSIVRQYCTIDSGVVLLAIAQSKEAVNNVIIGSHIVRDIVNLAAPDKDSRRKVLEMLVHEDTKSPGPPAEVNGASPSSRGRDLSISSSDGRRDESRTRSHAADHFLIDRHIDFLDIAGQTDGYMPGDLQLLVSRARSEALIRSLSSTTSESTSVALTRADFAAALKGFTPASLRNVTLQKSTTTWDAIGGLRATRQALLETLQYPTTYAPIFAACPLRLRSGLLLYGYPGCGKTLLASAVAGQCGLNFISVKGPEILNKYIGASEKSVRDLFERAQAARPCVLFFDEFDSIAPKRGHDSTGVTDRVVNQLLTQMDGAEGLSGVYVLAATSRPDLIDPALLRPGRLDKSLECGMPNIEDRLDILKAVGRKIRFSSEVQAFGLKEVARRTEGYSGADLQAVVYNAQLEAIHDVLGDDDEVLKPKTTDAANGVGASRTLPDFMYFRYGDKEGTAGKHWELDPKEAAERARIAQHLAGMQAARKKEKQKQQLHRQQLYDRPVSSHSHRPFSAHGVLHDDSSDDMNKGGEGNAKEPTIEWRHLQKSLESTRASISPEEGRRLAGIYRKFIEGRTGDLPNGQGSNEIGGRSSLM